MDDHIKKSKLQSKSFSYWYNVLECQLPIHMFVRSLREVDFILFIACLDKLCSIFVALDHTHYARWVAVFVNDLEQSCQVFLQCNRRATFQMSVTVRPMKKLEVTAPEINQAEEKIQ